MSKILMILAGAILVGVLGAWLLTPAPRAHDPILIRGDDEFTRERGVRSGTGEADDPYVISGWDIEATGETGYGVLIENVSAHFVLRDLHLQGPAHSEGAAVRIFSAAHGAIEGCTISGAVHGVEFASSTGLALRDTAIGVSGHGLRVTGETEDAYRHEIAADVIFNGYPIAYYHGLDGTVIEGLKTAHITVAASRNVTVTGNEVVSGDGITLAFVRDSEFTGNAVYRETPVTTGHGIYLYRSTGNRIAGNSMRNNRASGIQLSLSDRNVIEANQLLSNNTGIHLVASDENTLAGNILFANPVGVSVSGRSSGNEIVENIVYHENTSQGILLGSSNGNLVARNGFDNCESSVVVEADASGNRIVANTIVRGQYGILLTGSENRIESNLLSQQARALLFPETYGRETPTGNEIIGNVFADNGQHVYLSFDSTGSIFSRNAFLGQGLQQVADQGTANRWTSSGIGNYWSGSELTDEDGDGLGDGTVTVYPAAGQDTAPLTVVDPSTAGVGILSSVSRGTITLAQPDETTIDLPVFLAIEGHERWVGFRGFPQELIKDFPGILFVFESEENRRFTMLSVLFDLDIAFFDAAGELVGQATMIANSEDVYSASGPFQYALELAPGTLDARSIGKDSVLRIP